MAQFKTNYKFTDSGITVDFSDLFVPLELFSIGGLFAAGKQTAVAPTHGDGNSTHRSSPVQIISGGTNWKSVSRSTPSAGGIKSDGTLWMWGDNNFNALGMSSGSQLSPVQTSAGGTDWKSLALGYLATAAIKTDGRLYTWGYNVYGQLGNGTTTNGTAPVVVGLDYIWKSVSAGAYTFAAIKTDGTLWTWGYNDNGQLGDNSMVNKSSPVQTVSGGTNWKSVAVGSSNIVATKTDGTLWLWGRNAYGALGDSTITHRSSPVQTIAGGSNWKSAMAGSYHGAGIKTDGTLWTWGYNEYGQLGDNTVVHRSSPVQTIAGGTNWKTIPNQTQEAGFMGCIKTDGTLWLWGRNQYGQLGDNTIVQKSSPIQTVAGGTNWKSVAMASSSWNAITAVN